MTKHTPATMARNGLIKGALQTIPTQNHMVLHSTQMEEVFVSHVETFHKIDTYYYQMQWSGLVKLFKSGTSPQTMFRIISRRAPRILPRGQRPRSLLLGATAMLMTSSWIIALSSTRLSVEVMLDKTRSGK